MKRLFVAIELSPQVKAIAAEAKALLEQDGKEARWVAPDNVHLTLRFLGDCPDEQVEPIIASLRQALTDRVVFHCETTSFGTFPGGKQARILWLGVEAVPELMQLYDYVSSALHDLGFDPEKRPFRPHLTLARLKRPRLIDIGFTDSKIDAKQLINVEAVTLFAAHLAATGAVYESLAKIDLKRAKA
ncbi:MAG: RNA 2',3'-cyclic phosphodiesterase [Actinomycetota bacterium]|nr:RNA 2',3'-cyclic phosphodiesterase [Actinomycetota bacterium]